MSIRVATRRVRHNLLGWLAVSIAALLIGAPAVSSVTLPFAAAAIGVACGLRHWRRLRARIQRSGDPIAPNRIFVRFLSLAEPVVTAAAWNLPLLAIVVTLLGVLIWANAAFGGLLLVTLGAFGTACATAAGVALLQHEARFGPVHYQYASEHWGGGEAMLFSHGVVLERLQPEGWIRVEGERWRARSADGTTIADAQTVEVVDRDGFRLLVVSVSEDGTS